MPEALLGVTPKSSREQRWAIWTHPPSSKWMKGRTDGRTRNSRQQHVT